MQDAAHEHVAAARHDSHVSRRLLDGTLSASLMSISSSAPADITVVTTAKQLQAAMMSGAQDILIRAHLEFANVTLAAHFNTSLTPTVLGDVKPSTRSIRVC